MNLNKSAAWLSRLLGALLVIGFSSCNPYHSLVKSNDGIAAADKLIEILDNSYPFSGHKAIEWNEYKPIFTDYFQSNLNDSNYLSLRKFIYSIPDARIQIKSRKDKMLLNNELNGSVGFSISRLPDGSCRIIKIDTTSVAYQKGLRTGCRILSWNGQVIHHIIQEHEIAWGIHPANINFREILQDHFITSGTAGESVEVFYETSEGNNRGIRIPFSESQPDFIPDIIDIPGFTEDSPSFYTKNNIAVWIIEEFNQNTSNVLKEKILPELDKTDGLVIDLRRNTGGHDLIAAEIAGYFIEKETLYEEIIVWNTMAGEWMNMGHTHVHPQEEIYNKPVIILLGPLCNGAGEGFARVLLQQDNITSLGMWNSAGSFSYPGGVIKLKKNISIHYPIGMAVDEDGAILIESPGDYGGGIYPDIRITRNLANLAAICYGNDILLSEAFFHLKRK